MEQLETIKGKSIVIPKIVKRYLILTYHKNLGWQSYQTDLYSTPESALQNFLENATNSEWTKENIKYYKVIEVELEIPFI